MADLIDRKDAIGAILSVRHIAELSDGDAVIRVSAVNYVLRNLPSAQPERKTAELVYGEKDGADGWYCSKCGFHIPWYYDYYGLKNIDFIRDFHTCPCCDSKMLKYTGMRGENDG